MSENKQSTQLKLKLVRDVGNLHKAGDTIALDMSEALYYYSIGWVQLTPQQIYDCQAYEAPAQDIHVVDAISRPNPQDFAPLAQISREDLKAEILSEMKASGELVTKQDLSEFASILALKDSENKL
jgi:hypothetical protein